MSQKLRNFVFTVFNYQEGEVNREWRKQLLCLDPVYFIVGYETCPKTGKPHLQGYCELPKEWRFNTICKYLPKIDLDERKGTQEQAINYCKYDDYPTCEKLNKFEEYGSPKSQGMRSDLKILRDSLVKNETTVENIIMENPHYYHQYGRTIEKIEDLINMKKYRTWQTKGLYIYGPTGTGKSHKVFEDFKPETHYVLNLNDKGWWNGYCGQPIVIINEFRGQMTYNDLLELVDKWPKTVTRRNRQPYPFLAREVRITSSLPIEQVYYNLAKDDSFDQFYRRFEIIHLVNCRNSAQRGNNEPSETELIDECRTKLHAGLKVFKAKTI